MLMWSSWMCPRTAIAKALWDCSRGSAVFGLPCPVAAYVTESQLRLPVFCIIVTGMVVTVGVRVVAFAEAP
jgi:hypothetical protein